jgi:hypothetical protein
LTHDLYWWVVLTILKNDGVRQWVSDDITYIYIIYTHRIHGAGIYANLWGIFMGSMLPYIAAPWIRHGIYEMENHIKMFETTKQCTLESTFKDRASWINQPPPPQCFLVI